MIHLALVVKNGNNIGIAGHDTSNGRIVYKFIPSAQVCGDLIDLWTERTIISESVENEESGKGNFLLRTRITSSEKDYLGNLLAKAILPPYSIKYVEVLNQGDLSNLVLNEFEELV
jgi:hypothetical protein